MSNTSLIVSCPFYQEKRRSLFECLYNQFKIPMVKMSKMFDLSTKNAQFVQSAFWIALKRGT